jgi:uncharacterized protein YggU (UPF0235/DUF167 family)
VSRLVLSGATGRLKPVEIDSVTQADLERRFPGN